MSLQKIGNGETQDAFSSLTGSEIATNEWIHLTGVIDYQGSSGTLALYWNGVLSSTVPLTEGYDMSSIAAPKLLFGTESIFTTKKFIQGFSGDLDQLRVYDRALSASEIQALYQEFGDTNTGDTGNDSDGDATTSASQWTVTDDESGIYYSDKVGIGITNFDTDDYLLYVNDGIKAEKVKVELPGDGWSDFVFEKHYRLRSLDEVAAFINENGHLPDIPSEQTLKEAQGFDLGEMTKLQQMKIEELTLYLIQMNEEIKSNLLHKIETLNLHIKTLENRIQVLEKE